MKRDERAPITWTEPEDSRELLPELRAPHETVSSGMMRVRKAFDEVLDEPLVSDSGAFESAVTEARVEMFRESAATFGTPQYVLDTEALRSRAGYFLRTMRRGIPACSCFYAMKCNDLPMLVRTVKDEGFHADVAGLFELRLALRMGFEKIVFGSPGKSAEELALAIHHRDRVTINIDGLDELAAVRQMLGSRQLKRKVRVGFRIRPEVHAPSQPWSKFGMTFEQIEAALRIVRSTPSLAWTGLHIHTSWNKTPDRYVENIRRIATFLSNVEPESLRDFSFVDLGGGFYPEGQASLLKAEDRGVLLETLAPRLSDPHAVFDAIGYEPNACTEIGVEPLETFAARIGDTVRRQLTPLLPRVSIYLEPGRYLATHPTSILLTVMSTKGESVIVDGGINMLGDYKFSEYASAPILNATRPSMRVRRRVIFGPLCDPHDLWGHAHFGDVLRKGDVIAVLHQGAYTFSTAWRFIKALPPYVAIDGERLSLAKRAETFRDRYAGCAL